MTFREFSPPGYAHKRRHPLQKSRGSKQVYLTHPNPPPLYNGEECSSGSCVMSPKQSGKVLTRPAYKSLDQEVEELHSSLHETNNAMTENEIMLANYRLAQSRKMDELQSELNQSRDIPTTSSRCHSPNGPRYPFCRHAQPPPSAVGHSACEGGCGTGCVHGQERQLLCELEKEKQARERAEYSNAQMMDLLDSSLRNPSSPSPTPTFKEDVREKMKDHIKDLEDNHKKLESSSEVYEQRLKEIEEKLKESSQLNKTEGAFEELTQQVSQLKHDLWQREASEKRRKMLQQITILENDLSEERQQHSTSVRQTRKLYSQVKQLGHELGQAKQEKEKALTCLEVTSQHLNESLGGKDELIQKVEDLQEALSNSESQRIHCVEKCGHLSQECFQQEVCQEALRQRIKDVESKVENYKCERASLEEHQHILSQKLTEKTMSECHLHEQRDALQKQLAELESVFEGREVEFEGVVTRLKQAQRDCNEAKIEIVRLVTELKNAENQRNSMDSKIQVLDTNLNDTHQEFEKLRTESKEASKQLLYCAQAKKSLQAEVEEERKKCEQCLAQKKALQSRVHKLENHLEESEKRQASSYSQALQAVKKFKNQAKQTAQAKAQVLEERDSVMAQSKELQKQLMECQSILKHDQCRLSQREQENTELNEKLASIQSQLDEGSDEKENLHHKLIDLEAACETQTSNLEKCQHELAQCRHDNESLLQEKALHTKNIETSLEQARAMEKSLNIELITIRESSQSQIEQLKAEVEVCRNEKLKFFAKHKKLLGVYQSLKNEHEGQRMQCNQIDEERIKLEQSLRKMQEQLKKKDEEFSIRGETLKALQNQELKKLKQRHSQLISELRNTIASLEIKMADEHSTLNEVKRQQLKVLDDQQKVYADDLSKSMEDTERLRHKYLKAKKMYEDKAFTLENELSDCSGENESLRQKLNESHAILMQQIEEHESILKAAAYEVDAIVHQMGLRVDVPMFATVVGDETDIKKWMADMLAKLKWLQNEVTDLLTEENKLRQRVKSENKIDAVSLDKSFNLS